MPVESSRNSLRSVFSLIKPALNVLTSNPVLAIFEVNMKCNQACGFCDLPLNRGRYEMSQNEIRRVFGDLFAEGLRYVIVQGGEPLIRKDIVEILQDLAEIGFSLSLVTNGTALTPQFVERIQNLPLSIAVSLDTLNRQRYQKIRGKDQLGLVLEGITNLSAFKGHKSIVTIINDINKDDVEDVAKFTRMRGFTPIIGAYHWGIGQYGKINHDLQFRRDAAIKIFQSLIDSDVLPKGFARIYAKSNVAWLSRQKLSHCDAGRYSIVVGSAGEVSPCLAHKSVGSLLTSSLRDILRKLDHQEIRKCSDNSTCNVMCSRVVGHAIRNPSLVFSNDVKEFWH